jgi:hypothetical protein
MWFRNRTAEVSRPPTALATNSAAFELVLPPEFTAGDAAGAGWIASRRVSRNTALAVPAVFRARNQVCTTLGTLGFRGFRDGKELTGSALPSILQQLTRGIPNATVMAYIYEDMLFYGKAWFLVKETTTGDATGFPTWVERVDPMLINDQNFPAPNDQGQPTTGQQRRTVTIAGIGDVKDNQLIRIDSPTPPLLDHGARAIRTLWVLDALSDVYADGGQPLGYFTPTDPQVEYFDEEAESGTARHAPTFLARWIAARKLRSIAYVPGGLKYVPNMLNAKELQLVEARQHAVLEIARLTGVDAEDLSVSTTSRTYTNEVDRRKAFLDFTCSGLFTAVEQRMSMGDVTPRGTTVKMDTRVFLRNDLPARYAAHRIALGPNVPFAEVDEVRAEEGMGPMSSSSTQQSGGNVA